MQIKKYRDYHEMIRECSLDLIAILIPLECTMNMRLILLKIIM